MRIASALCTRQSYCALSLLGPGKKNGMPECRLEASHPNQTLATIWMDGDPETIPKRRSKRQETTSGYSSDYPNGRRPQRHTRATLKIVKTWSSETRQGIVKTYSSEPGPKNGYSKHCRANPTPPTVRQKIVKAKKHCQNILERSRRQPRILKTWSRKTSPNLG